MAAYSCDGRLAPSLDLQVCGALSDEITLGCCHEGSTEAPPVHPATHRQDVYLRDPVAVGLQDKHACWSLVAIAT